MHKIYLQMPRILIYLHNIIQRELKNRLGMAVSTRFTNRESNELNTNEKR